MVLAVVAAWHGAGTGACLADRCGTGAETARKIVIAHRGASAYLPEHTLEAASMAYAMGADFIEQDVVLTKDLVPIVLHDIYLNATTNVREVFPDRARPDRRWYAIDFALSEVKALRVNERVNPATGIVVFTGRFPVGKSKFEVPTLAEEIELILGLNKSTGRNVGIYPEIKGSAFHLREAFDIDRIVLNVLYEYGYRDADSNIFVQSFEAHCLMRLRFEFGTKLRLVQLIAGSRDYDAMVTREGLDKVATYANGIGPTTSRIMSSRGQAVDNLSLVREAQARGLVVHPYTFRAEALPSYARSLEEELRRYYFEIGVDGVFTDNPDIAHRVLQEGER
jgi:glycerophosphoryl diester phosphodiesterase